MSRFVSGGTIGPSGEQAAARDDESKITATGAESQQPLGLPQQQEQQQQQQQPLAGRASRAEWEAVQQELDRKRAEQKARLASGGEERSLYDVLQANKAAKQAAFEEQNKIRNQFRALDDDEIDFLDDVLAKKRLEEERVRRETEEGLRAFRQRQLETEHGNGMTAAAAAAAAAAREGGDGAATQNEGGEVKKEGKEDEAEAEDWAAARKRKRARDKDKGLVKKKKAAPQQQQQQQNGHDEVSSVKELAASKTEHVKVAGSKKSALVSYGSDDSDDD
ncbi:NEFA-interacting nuclear protein NIP30 [Moelleriella libera RCEF 2490]|uniref:NEFA-interacting nuclear protein NIP30 n=1 Tax=Moelleriella libera RCEF 2490 TaxID=1081109 RepID=A0A166PD68_9HYPO|nr:NEFA-interacting nuclear protein NIP30 [Moelleriella libera RCEF 2490]